MYTKLLPSTYVSGLIQSNSSVLKQNESYRAPEVNPTGHKMRMRLKPFHQLKNTSQTKTRQRFYVICMKEIKLVSLFFFLLNHLL